MGVVIFTERDPTWPATQVDPRPVESGLGGHDVGVFGVDDRVKTTSHPLWKRVGTAMSKCGTFSGYAGCGNEGTLINQTQLETRMTTSLITSSLALSSLTEIHRRTKRKIVGLFSVQSSLMRLRETK